MPACSESSIKSRTTDKNFYKKLIGIALPIALQSLISSSLTLLDNLMVSKLGELALTSVGLATQSFSLQWMMIFGFCSGCSTFFTQFWGVRDLKNIRKTVGVALMTCFSVSFVLFLIGLLCPVSVLRLFTNSEEAAVLGAKYLRIASVNFLLISLTQPLATSLRATQQTRIPMYISIAAFVTDALFNYLLIFGKLGFPQLGVAGAAIATVLARVLELTLTVIVIFKGNNIIKGKIREFFDFDRNFVRHIYANAVITTVNETLWCGAIVCQNAAYGHLGVTAYAAVQASTTVMDLFQMACFSVGDASLILIGEQLGQNKIEEGRKISARLLKVGWGLSVFMSTLLIIFNRPIISLFSLSELGVHYANKIIVIRALLFPLQLQNGLLVSGIFRAGGGAKFAAISEILIMWIYTVPAAFVGALVFQLPIYRVVLLVQLESVVKGVILLKYYFSGKWLKNMISGL